MRRAKSYSIIDHEVLHGGYLHRLSHCSMILYLFLVVVGDREGKSFYGEKRIMEILRIDENRFQEARLELINEGLIDYHSPYYFVKSIWVIQDERYKTKDTVFKRGNEDEFSRDRRTGRDLTKICFKDLLRKLY